MPCKSCRDTMEPLPFRATKQSLLYEGINSLPVSVVLDNVRSLYNVGSFFRTCDSAGTHELYLTGITGKPPHRGISKTALGAEDIVNWRHYKDAMTPIKKLRKLGYEIAIVETSPNAIDLYTWEPSFPVCIIFGNEIDGVNPAIAERTDIQVRIPSLGVKQSLNVATAGGLLIYELLRKYLKQWQSVPNNVKTHLSRPSENLSSINNLPTEELGR